VIHRITGTLDLQFRFASGGERGRGPLIAFAAYLLAEWITTWTIPKASKI